MVDDDANDETSPSILFEVFALGQQVRQLLADAMADSPLSPQDYAFLSAVFEDEAPTPTRLANRLGMPLSTTVEQVQLFERRGFLRRSRNPRDGRSYFVTLTAAGSRAHRQANGHFEATYAAVVSRLGRSEPAVARALAQLRTAVRQAQERVSADR
jgi:DNA-binding MarR family transcriptional regulator